MKPIRFAFVGLGNIAKTHIVALRAMPVVKKLPFVPILDTLVTRNPELNREQAHAIGFRNVVSSVDEALQTGDIDVVDICTPNAMHFDEAIKASQAGKAIYLEKPLTETYDRSKQLVGSISSSLTRQVALVYRYHPAVMRIRAALAENLIGDVLQCKIRYMRSGYLNAARPVSWRLETGLSGGGAITDLGVHILDMFQHWFGEIIDVHGQTNTFVKQRPSAGGNGELVRMTVDDWALMHVTTASGVQGVAEVSRIAWGADALDVEIVGTKGSIVCDLEKEYILTVKLLDGSSPKLPVPAELVLVPDDKSTMGMSLDSHFGALNHFLHRIAGEDRWEGIAPSFEDCLKTEEWIERVIQQNKR